MGLPKPIPAAPQRTILVVDDEQELAELLSSEVASLGYKAFWAKGPAQALKIAHGIRIDAIVTDVRMPDGGGIAILNGIRNSPFADIPVIFVSSYNDVSEDEIIQKGGFAVLPKPLSIERLKEVLDLVFDDNKFRIRPEDFQSIEVEFSLAVSADELLPAKIVEYSGDSLILEISGGKLAVSQKLKASIETRRTKPEVFGEFETTVLALEDLGEGDALVTISIPAQHGHLFGRLNDALVARQSEILAFLNKAKGTE